MQALKVSRIVMDGYTARILLGAYDRAVSALELSRRFGIPIAACYRRIRRLEAMGLLYCESELPSRNGKGLQLFRSLVRSVRVSYEGGRILARIEVRGPKGHAVGNHAEQVLTLHDRPPGP